MSQGRLALALGGVVLSFALGFAVVRPDNFGGTDEWIDLDLVMRGCLGAPFANRPLLRIWMLPAARIVPYSLSAYLLLHAAYLAAAGVLSLLLVRRLAPGHPRLWFACGVLAACWAPQDFLRLNAVGLLGYSGALFGSLLSLLLAEAARTERPAVAALAGALAFATARGFEGVLPVLCAAAAVPMLAGRRSRLVAAGYAVPVGLAALATLLPLTAGGPSYQASALGVRLAPWHVASRLASLLAMHLDVSLPPAADLLAPTSLLAGAVAAGVYLALPQRAGPGQPAPTAWLRLALAGALLAALANLGFAVLASPLTPGRTQFVSTPGIALVLACLIVGSGQRLPARAGGLAGAAALGLLASIAAGRVVGHQRAWNEASYFPDQKRLLAGILRAAPELLPGTLVILLDPVKTFAASFTFRHAVDLLYDGHAKGIVPGGQEFLYPWRFTAAGVRIEPMPAIRKPWRVEPELYRYDEAIVLETRPDGGVELLREWPPLLAPLPAGARYEPAARITAARGAVAARGLLE